MNIIQRPASPTNYQSGRKHVIDQITFHHIVGNAPGGTDSFQTPNHGVSSTYAIAADGTIYQYVQEGDTPWTDANASSNSRAITIEHAGPPYAEAMYRASIELCRDIRSRYNITRFMRHRDVSDTPTACPGELDVERVVNESGEDMETRPTEQQVKEAYHKHNLDENSKPTEATPQDLAYYPTRPVAELYAVLLDHETALVHELVDQSSGDATILKPGNYQVKG